MIKEERSLTPSELKAKRFLFNLIKDGSLKSCDGDDEAKVSESLPHWCNQEKFKRGQKYFWDNRLGMLNSTFFGFFVLLGDPKTSDILYSTGRSNSPAIAKKRYVSTILQMLSWYEVDSSFRISLSKVRKMHLNASRSAVKKEIGFITQVDMALSTIGLIGFVLVRPQYLGICCDNKEDREGFIHFWAVLSYMLGIDDEFNVCLFDTETVENICMITLRYIFIPLIQLESPKFKAMSTALLDGIAPFLPYVSYDNQIFLVKRIVGVPGYQYRVDRKKEKICGQIFSSEELSALKEAFRTIYKDKKDLVELYDILFNDGIPLIANSKRGSSDAIASIENLERNECILVGDKKFNFIKPSKGSSDWQHYLHEEEYSFLSKWDRFVVFLYCFIFESYASSVGRYFCEKGFNVVLFFVRRYYNRHAVDNQKS